jgi:hypothetical protein
MVPVLNMTNCLLVFLQCHSFLAIFFLSIDVMWSLSARLFAVIWSPGCLRTRLPPHLVPHAPTRTSCLAPRAALASCAMCHLRLALRSAAPSAFRPGSRCAQPRSDLRAVASSFVQASSSASTSVHWGQHVDEHICNWMFNVFQMYVAYVSSRCCKSRSGVAYVAMTIHVCCKCMFQMFRFFQTYVASVLSGCSICCAGGTCMLQVYVSNILFCFKRMLQVFYLDIVFIAKVCCKCFTYFRCML